MKKGDPKDTKGNFKAITEIVREKFSCNNKMTVRENHSLRQKYKNEFC